MAVASNGCVPLEPRNRRDGFTLIELMVVLVVVGALLSAAMPSMSAGLTDRRVAMVARDVVSLFQRARYMSMAYGRAHQVVYTNDSGAGLTTQAYAFETRRGTSGSCSLTSFENAANIKLTDLDCGANWRCVDSLYANTYDADPGDNDLIRVDGWKDSSFCYEAGSNDQVFVDTVLYANWQSANAQAGFGFLVYRQVGGNTVGVARKVLIPLGSGSPRVLR